MKIMLHLAVCAASLMLFSGCAATQAHIGPSYQPQQNVQRLNGAEKVAVNVTMSDERQIQSCVGKKMNGYGMEMAPIIATNDVVELTRQAIETELAHRGFAVVNTNAVNVMGELHRFYNEFRVGFWSGDAIAEVTVNIVVKNADGAILYTKLINGQGVEPSIQLASGNNACLALNAALKDATQRLFGHQSFTEALLKTSGSAETNHAAVTVPSSPK